MSYVNVSVKFEHHLEIKSYLDQDPGNRFV